MSGVSPLVSAYLIIAVDWIIARMGLGWLMSMETEEQAWEKDSGRAEGRETEKTEETEEPEAGWMRRAAGGDEKAWQNLFERWKLPLLSYFYRSLGSREEAEDLTLEVFVRLNRAAAEYRPTAKFSTYLFQIARNLMLNELRRRRRKPAEVLPPEAFDYVAEGNAQESRRMNELEEVLQAALGRLPEKLRTPLLLIQQQGLGYPETADALGITENALRVTLFRARQKLRELMAECAGEG